MSLFQGRFARVLALVALTSFGTCFSCDGATRGEDIVPANDSTSFFRVLLPEKPNTVSFEPVDARFCRVRLFSSVAGAPAIDELEVYSHDDSTTNLARLPKTTVNATSCISGYAIHSVENLTDGQYGNDHAWVSADPASYEAPQEITLNWEEPVRFDTVVFSRDRNGGYKDRMPMELEVCVSNDGLTWTSVAAVHGVPNPIADGSLATYGSSWFTTAPQGAPCDWRALQESQDFADLEGYDALLRDSFLAEENAILKVAGFADCEPWLLQRHYPEYVEPLHSPETILPAPIVSNVPDWNDYEKLETFWRQASRGGVWAFAPGSFTSGPTLEQYVDVALTSDFILVRISGNRFLSEHRAMIATEATPTRGMLLEKDGDVYWKQIDPMSGRAVNSLTVLQGHYDSDSGILQAAIPLDFLPECMKRGFYVALGFGGRYVFPGGRPVHFRPAKFALALEDYSPLNNTFTLRANVTDPSCEVTLASDELTIALSENQSRIVTKEIDAIWGYAGPQATIELCDHADKTFYRIVGFHYDPCYRPFCQLRDMLERAELPATAQRDRHDFEKFVSLPGAYNPRYSDPQTIENAPNDGGLSALTDYFETLANLLSQSSYVSSQDPFYEFKARACKVWENYLGAIRQNGALDQTTLRQVFWRLRLLKRDLTLSEPDLEPLESILANKRHPFHPSHNYSDLFDSAWRPGGAVVKIEIPRVDGKLRPDQAVVTELVEAEDGVIRNPSLSFDAQRLYYAWRQNQDEYYRVYEMDLATGAKRRISPDGPFHDFWPTELPNGDLAFISTRVKKKFICWRPQAFVLYRMDRNGENLQELSHANLSEFAPSIDDAGRILWTRSEYVDKGADYGHTLWTIHTDGASPELVFGNTINLPQGYANGRMVPDATEICCTLISHFGDLNGPIALVDLSRGPHEPDAIRSITPEVPWPGFWGRSEVFREPYPISRDFILTAYAPLERFGLYLIDRYGNRELLTIDPEIDTICPQPFCARETPRETQSVFDRELVAEKLGRFSVVNVYRGLEGQVEKGAAKYLRVCQEMPTPLKLMEDGTYQADHEPFMEYYASPVDVLQGAYGWTSYVAKGVLGVVEIEEDGSVDFIAPAEKVLFFELLDENYNEIQRMRSVVQLQPGEQRSCVGCHESRLSTPEGGLTNASTHESQRLQEPPWGAGAFWYERVVQPVLDKRCVSCHNAEVAAQAPRIFDLSGERDENKIPASYRSLVVSGAVHYFDYTWGGGKTTKAEPYSFGVSKSKLWDILKQEQHNGVQLAPEEEQALKCWIDLNVPLWGDYQRRSERE
ncbi:MAG: discoidin domain-containing protein [Planctomycetia bacterium]|nr:discoidin domain-containing protein [Planctomycetia bacterium]